MHITEFEKAAAAIQPWLVKTPLITFAPLNAAIGRTVYLKCEHQQITGSFKIRGCLHAILESDRNTPKITRSSGNFGQAMAWCGAKLAIPVTIVMPDNTSPLKIEKTKQYGANVLLAGPAYDACEQLVQKLLQQHRMHYIPPSDDPHVIAGQGTISLEILHEFPSITALYGPIGGGGLMSGCATAMKSLKPSVKIIGAEPENANDYCLSRKTGSLLSKTASTIADGLRASSVGKKNWPLLQQHLDHAIEIPDQHILHAMNLLYQTTGIVAEPSGAISLAALIAHPIEGDTVCIISGGNRLPS